MRLFDGKHICDTWHEDLSRNKMPCQTVFNKMSLDPITIELKDLKKLEKILIFKVIIFKKWHEKGNLQKLRVVFVISPLKQKILCNILPGPKDSNKLIVVKRKQNLSIVVMLILNQYVQMQYTKH